MGLFHSASSSCTDTLCTEASFCFTAAWLPLPAAAEADALRVVGAAEAETTKAKVTAAGTDRAIAQAVFATESLKDAKSVHVVSSGLEVFQSLD